MGTCIQHFHRKLLDACEPPPKLSTGPTAENSDGSEKLSHGFGVWVFLGEPFFFDILFCAGACAILNPNFATRCSSVAIVRGRETEFSIRTCCYLAVAVVSFLNKSLT